MRFPLSTRSLRTPLVLSACVAALAAGTVSAAAADRASAPPLPPRTGVTAAAGTLVPTIALRLPATVTHGSFVTTAKIAVISNTRGKPTGTVTVRWVSRKFGGGALGLGTTIPAPRDTFFFNAPTQPGRYNLAVHYSGDSNFKSADANAVLVVN